MNAIDREEAIRLIASYPGPVDKSVVRRLLTQMPERKKGHWQIYIISMLDGEGCKCSECGHEGAPYWDFCPNCGAELEGCEQDG